MSNQAQESIETKTASENADIQPVDENQTTENNEKIETSSSSENKTSNDQEPPPPTATRRIVMAQDIRYSTEQGDRDKLIEKYNNYQVSDTNSCNIRFLTDHRQKKNLFGRNEGTDFRKNLFLFFIYSLLEENSNLHSIAKTFNVNIHVRMSILSFV